MTNDGSNFSNSKESFQHTLRWYRRNRPSHGRAELIQGMGNLATVTVCVNSLAIVFIASGKVCAIFKELSGSDTM